MTHLTDWQRGYQAGALQGVEQLRPYLKEDQ